MLILFLSSPPPLKHTHTHTHKPDGFACCGKTQRMDLPHATGHLYIWITPWTYSSTSSTEAYDQLYKDALHLILQCLWLSVPHVIEVYNTTISQSVFYAVSNMAFTILAQTTQNFCISTVHRFGWLCWWSSINHLNLTACQTNCPTNVRMAIVNP